MVKSGHIVARHIVYFVHTESKKNPRTAKHELTRRNWTETSTALKITTIIIKTIINIKSGHIVSYYIVHSIYTKAKKNTFLSAHSCTQRSDQILYSKSAVKMNNKTIIKKCDFSIFLKILNVFSSKFRKKKYYRYHIASITFWSRCEHVN